MKNLLSKLRETMPLPLKNQGKTTQVTCAAPTKFKVCQYFQSLTHQDEMG